MSNTEFFANSDKYKLGLKDFSKTLDRYVFSAIYNLYLNEAREIHSIDIDNYLKSNPAAAALFKKENGLQFVQDCEVYSDSSNFDYYYSKLKKLNLLRDLEKEGYDVSDFICEDPLDDKYNQINEAFEKLSIEDILNKVKTKIFLLEEEYDTNSNLSESKPTDGLRNLIADLKIAPDVGVKLQGNIYNSIFRGGRKGTLMLRSAPTSVGKSRLAVGDACYIAYPVRYEPKLGRWIATGQCEKVLYVMTEQSADEIQTMVLAYLTGINEEYFKLGTFTEEHMKIINKAVEIMETYDNLYFARIPEPTPSLIKNLFRRYKAQHGVDNFFFDYIFSNQAMLDEYKSQNLPEHVCLRFFTTALKNLAIELKAFVSSSTQISEQENDKKSSWKDYHNIAGARAIAHLVDCGCIVSRPTQEELKMLEHYRQSSFDIMPNFVIDVYKNRGGRWTMLRIWCYNDLGTCRRIDLFATTPDLKPIEDFELSDFVNDIAPEFEELVNELNKDSVILPIEDTLVEEPLEQTLSQTINEAFGNYEEERKRVHEMDWDDLV